MFLASKYLEGLYLYFKNTSWEKIRNDVDSKDEFPFKTYHLTAMKIFSKMFENANSEGRAVVNIQFLADFYFLPYFNSDNFKEKLLADVALRLNVREQVDYDGVLLAVKITRAKKSRNEDELKRASVLVERLRSRCDMVREFYGDFEKTANGICKQIDRLLLRPSQPEYFTNPNPKLREYMLKFDALDVNLLMPMMVD